MKTHFYASKKHFAGLQRRFYAGKNRFSKMKNAFYAGKNLMHSRCQAVSYGYEAIFQF